MHRLLITGREEKRREGKGREGKRREEKGRERKEWQGRLQFATNLSQRRAEAARKGVAPRVTDRELHANLLNDECQFTSAIVFISL